MTAIRFERKTTECPAMGREMRKALAALAASTALVGTAVGRTSQSSGQSLTEPQLHLAGKIIGNGAFDDRCQMIGTIEEVVFNNDGDLHELIVNVSVYLGIDGKRVSLSTSEVKLQLDQLDDKCPEQVLVLIDKDQS